MIDIDQTEMKIEGLSPHFGRTVSWERCHFERVYTQERKLNLMMAISVDQAYNTEWHDQWSQEDVRDVVVSLAYNL